VRPPLSEQILNDINYRIMEADKNTAMHADKAATLRSFKDLIERRIDDDRKFYEQQAKNSARDGGANG
jgi:hypothetical protein